MNSKTLTLIIVITLQATIVGLLCYLCVAVPRPGVWLLVLEDATKPDLDVATSAEKGTYGLRTDDLERIARQEESERGREIKSFRRRYTSTVLRTPPIVARVGALPGQLNSELQRYGSMSDEEKREFEKRLANHVAKSQILEETLDRAREVIRNAASRPAG